MEYLIGIIVMLLGGFFYQKTKKESAEALNENAEVKGKVAGLDVVNASEKAQIEELKKSETGIKAELEKKKQSDETVKELLDFLDKNLK